MLNGKDPKYKSNNQVNNADSSSTSLWIGNVDRNVTEDMLNEMFSAYGHLSNVRYILE